MEKLGYIAGSKIFVHDHQRVSCPILFLFDGKLRGKDN